MTNKERMSSTRKTAITVGIQVVLVSYQEVVIWGLIEGWEGNQKAGK